MFIIAHWSIFIMAALKDFLSDNSTISVILVLASIVFFIQFEIFLVPEMMSDVLLNARDFRYYVMFLESYLNLF